MKSGIVGQSAPELPLTVLEFNYRANDDVSLPPMPGGVWHGVFGAALRRLVCVTASPSCDECLLLHSCGYPYLFQRVAPPDSAMMRGRLIPVPHIFRFPGNRSWVPAGGRLAVGINIVGDAAAKVNEIILAMQRVGMTGLGKERSRLTLTSVIQHRPHDSLVIHEQGRSLTVPEPQFAPLPSCPERVRMELLTPLSPTGRGRGEDLGIPWLLMALVRRVSLLQYFYTGRLLKADFKSLKRQVESMEPVAHELRWKKGKRYSARQRRTVSMGGWSGWIELEIGDAPLLWSSLWLGQWLGVGKNASMGYGSYLLRPCESVGWRWDDNHPSEGSNL